ncbi:hypothetical protein U9M48_040475 [Paspalum notatum var. saurae]|uniref:Reverse transcriptase domain-containing protein n=1 Tax=Paspalum notatum var. saurae TaxID=547442 RepID=A0AAQ3ULT2_PASNO
MEHNKAPGPDGFAAEFYQVFWEIIKADLMAMFYDFYKGDLRFFSLNFGVITLLPKCQEAVKIQQFRPICPLNVSFKIFTKIATKRINVVAQKVIQPSQTTFLLRRYILEGVTILHETIHELHKKKLNGVIFKIDFEKAYDNVKWHFLQQTLRMKGFSPLWCQWIQQFVSKGSVAVKINNNVGRYFQTNKGLRQGDPLSPILFNLVVDMLAIFITRAKENGQVQGLVPHLVDGDLSILQYADDTILFMEHNLEQAKNMKIILCVFEKLSGLKINFHKIPKGILKKLDFYRSTFFWQGNSYKKKYRLARWEILCFPKGRLGKWLYKLINEEGVWQNILKKKYLRGKSIGEVQWKPGDSHFWSGLTKVKEHFLELSSFNLRDVAAVFSSTPLNVSFRRALVGDRLQKWKELVSKIALVQLDDQPDSIKWNLSKHGCFTVNSMYNHLVNQTALLLNKFLWRLKLPLKSKIYSFGIGVEMVNVVFVTQMKPFNTYFLIVIFRATYWTRSWSALQKRKKDRYSNGHAQNWTATLLATYGLVVSIES